MTSLNYFIIAYLPSVFNTFFYFVMPEEFVVDFQFEDVVKFWLLQKHRPPQGNVQTIRLHFF